MFHPALPQQVLLVSEHWPPWVGEAMEEAAREPHLRTAGKPRFSMPAAELFTAYACTAAARETFKGTLETVSAVIAVGDCMPACNALNRASSPNDQMRPILDAARDMCTHWLAVHVPRELNTDADLLSHPSRYPEVVERIEENGLRSYYVKIPPYCWDVLQSAISATRDGPDSIFDTFDL